MSRNTLRGIAPTVGRADCIWHVDFDGTSNRVVCGLALGRDRQRRQKKGRGQFCVSTPTRGGFNWFPASGIAGFLVLQDAGQSPGRRGGRGRRIKGRAVRRGCQLPDARATLQPLPPHSLVSWRSNGPRGYELSRRDLKLAHVVSRCRTTADRAVLQLDSPQHETRVPQLRGRSRPAETPCDGWDAR